MGAKDKLLCPVCHNPEGKFVETCGPWVRRYRCPKCGLYYRYDTRPAFDPRRVNLSEALHNPYASFGLKNNNLR